MRKYILLLWFPVCLLIGLFLFQGTVFAEEFKIKTRDSEWNEKLIINADVRWKDRAHIILENITVKVTDDKLLTDPDSPISTEARSWIGSNTAGINGLGDDVEKSSAGEFKDGNPFDTNAWYGKDICGKNVDIFKVAGMDAKSDGTITIDLGELKLSDCVNNLLDKNSAVIKSYEVKSAQQEQFRSVWFRFTSQKTIKNVFTDVDFEATNANTPNIFFNKGDTDGGNCGKPRFEADKAKLDGNDQAVPGTYETCDTAGRINATAWRDNKATLPATPQPTDSTGTNPDDGCEVQLLNPLTWLMCPLIEAGILAVTALDNAITEQLTVKTDELFNEKGDPAKDPGPALFNTWASFRYISLGVLVIVGLVMIISQAFSFGVFDAYTIKKVLPKILIGVIGISVSWYLCKFAIEVFNDLGVGVRSLLYGPFKGLGGAKFDAGPVSLLGVGTGVLVVGLGVVGILSFVATALLAVVIAFGILVFRRVLIILLVVTAPLAIVCWILPNTEKVWKMWWDFFIRALVVFPIIALFIAGGRVIAQIATLEGDTAGGNTFLASTVAFIAYFGPYFALPAAFRLAGGAIATIGGVANDRGRGAFDRLKQGRQKRFSDRVNRATQGGLYNKNTRRGRFGNKVAGTMFEPHNYAALYGDKALKASGKLLGKKGGFQSTFLSRRAEQIMGGIQNQAVEEAQNEFQYLNNNGFNDKAYLALTGQYKYLTGQHKAGGTVGDQIQKAIAEGRIAKDVKNRGFKDFQEIGRIMEGDLSADDHTTRIGGRALMSQAGHLGSLNSSDKSTLVDLQGVGAMGWAQHGFAPPTALADVYNDISERSGVGQAQALVSRAQILGQGNRIDLKAGYGVLVDEGGKASSIYDPKNKQRLQELITSFKPHDVAGAKAGAIRDMIFSDADKGEFREGSYYDMAMGNGVDEETQRAVRDQIVLGASRYGGSDADAKKHWIKLAQAVGLEAEIHATDEAMHEREKRGLHDGPHGGGGGGTPGSVIPGPPGPPGVIK